MAVSVADKAFAEYVVELMESVGPVSFKSMFGGYGIYLDSLMFGLIADRVLYLKVDKESLPDFEAAGLSAFTYYKQNKPFKMSYYEAPEIALEDADEMNLWANKGYRAALRVAASKGLKKHGKTT